MTPFSERAQEMGLDDSLSYKGLFTYQDRYGKIAYRVLKADGGVYEEPSENQHPTDGAESPLIGIWTALPTSNNYNYIGHVSQIYKFLGNAVLIDRLHILYNQWGVQY